MTRILGGGVKVSVSAGKTTFLIPTSDGSTTSVTTSGSFGA